MSADLLLRAATKLREHANAVELGPWDAADDGLVWPNCIGDPVSGSVLIEDARYIALMHPPVALALAEWLEQAAADFEIGRVLGGFQPRSVAGAIATSRAVLREPEVTS